MGNHIGVDVSGSIIRVACVCFPKNIDAPLSSIKSRDVWEAVEIVERTTQQQQNRNELFKEETDGIRLKPRTRSSIYPSPTCRPKQRLYSLDQSASNVAYCGPDTSCSHNRYCHCCHSCSPKRGRKDCDASRRSDDSTCLLESRFLSSCLCHHCRHQPQSKQDDQTPVNPNLPHSDSSRVFPTHTNFPHSDQLPISQDPSSHFPVHHSFPHNLHNNNVSNDDCSSKSYRPLSDCSYRRVFHSFQTPEEIRIQNYLDSAPLWGPPRTFCFKPKGLYPGKAFCFVINLSDSEDALKEALPYIQGSYLQLTGSGAAALRDLILNKFPSINLRLQFHREISCILEALDFLVYQVPGAVFRYLRTHRALNSVLLPDDTSYTAILLDKKDRDNFYPFLLVNLKAGVSFHLVTSPNQSERVGGSTIGGGTFMGLIRLLCNSISSPLDAFLLAQSGDNSTTDMLVEDIYGGDYTAIGLKGTIVASTFGKLQHNCPKTLKPANLCPKKWVKQTHRRKHKQQPSNSTDLSSSKFNPKVTPNVDRIDSSKCFDSPNTSDPSTLRSKCLDSTAPSNASSTVNRSNSEPLPSDSSTSSFVSGSVSPVFVKAANSVAKHRSEDARDELNSLFSAAAANAGVKIVADASAAAPPTTHPPTVSRIPVNSNIPSRSSLPLSYTLPSDCCAPAATPVSCSDPVCCCCGLQKWASCEATEASAAAALGFFQGDQMSGVEQLKRLESSPADLEAEIELSDDECRTHVALDPLKGVVDDEMSEKRRRAFSIDQFIRQPTEADVARSILTMTSFNVAQQAYLNSVIYSCSRIVLVGYYLEMPGFLSSIQHCIDFWSGGKCKINFVRLAMNLGALGASLRTRRRTSSAYI